MSEVTEQFQFRNSCSS